MTRDQRRRRSGAPPRARRRGRVPSLPLERASPGPLLGHRRCHEHSGPQPLCAAYRTRFRPWCGRQMDRRREPERAWRSLGSDPPQPQPARSRRGHGRSAPLSRPAASPDPIAAESRSCATSSERLFRSGAPPVSCRTPRSRHAGRGLSARPRHHRTARLARLALSPVGLLPRDGGRSARKLAGAACCRHRSRRQYHRHPAHLARSTAARQGAARRSAPRPRPSARQWRALRQGGRHPRRRRRRRDHARAQIGAALIAGHCRALGQPPRRPRPAPCPAPPLCRPRQRRGRSPGGDSGCTNAASPPASKSASSCRSMATSTSISAVSAPRACGHISRISSSPPTGRAFCPIHAAPIRGGEPQRHLGSVGAAPEGRRAFRLRRRCASAGKEPRMRPSRAAICRRRSRVAMAPASYFPPPGSSIDTPWGRDSPALHREAK